MSEDLVTWLRAQLDEDERVARSLGDLADSTARNGIESTAGRGVLDYLDHFPARRALAEVEAKRRILDEVVSTMDGMDNRIEGEWGMGRMKPEDYESVHLIKLLALPHADRPGYREEWRP